MNLPHTTPKIILPVTGNLVDLSNHKLTVIRPNEKDLDLPLKRFYQKRPSTREHRSPPISLLTKAKKKAIFSLFSRLAPRVYEEAIKWPGDISETAEEIRDFALIDRIFKTRIDLYMLLHSNGGNVLETNIIREIATLVHQSGGEVFAYMGNRAKSGAGQLFLEADECFAVKGSEWMDHQTGVPSEVESVFLYIFTQLYCWLRKSSETNDMSKRLKAKSTDPEAVDDLLSKAKQTRRNEINLSSQQLDQLGILSGQFTTIKSLAEKFTQDTGLKVNFENPTTEIDYFFCIIIFEKIAEKLSGTKVELSLTPGGKINFFVNSLDHNVWYPPFKMVKDLLKEVRMPHQLERVIRRLP